MQRLREDTTTKTRTMCTRSHRMCTRSRSTLFQRCTLQERSQQATPFLHLDQLRILPPILRLCQQVIRLRRTAQFLRHRSFQLHSQRTESLVTTNGDTRRNRRLHVQHRSQVASQLPILPRILPPSQVTNLPQLLHPILRSAQL